MTKAIFNRSLLPNTSQYDTLYQIQHQILYCYSTLPSTKLQEMLIYTRLYYHPLRIKLWDMLILVPNVIFFSYLLLKLSSVLTTLKRFNRYIFTVLFALVRIFLSCWICWEFVVADFGICVFIFLLVLTLLVSVFSQHIYTSNNNHHFNYHFNHHNNNHYNHHFNH